MRINLETLALVGVVGYLVWRWQRLELPDPHYDEAAQGAFWNSSLGGLAEAGAGAWYSLTDWQAAEPYSAREAAEVQAVADNLNKDMGWNSGSLGSL